MLIPKRIEIIIENVRDLMIEKFITVNALTKTIVRPVKNVITNLIVLKIFMQMNMAFVLVRTVSANEQNKFASSISYYIYRCD